MINLNLRFLLVSKETVIHIFNKSQLMNNSEVSFKSTDQIIDKLKSIYTEEGLSGVTHWVDESFRTDTQLSMARDVTNLNAVDQVLIYDRSIIQLNGVGEETNTFYLKPLHDDAFDSNLFLSIRLHFVEQPFELLIYTK